MSAPSNNLRSIYDAVLSCYAQFSDIHDAMLRLNQPGRFETTTTTDILQDWMIDEADSIQAAIGKLAEKLWNLPEVNQHDR